ncbi:hypothetical protein [Prosthecomicrobium sp. N25]|uniref:hypothetical protein n=1 Tax=Prosthecomicrobium sp. N25 TaxID=3129254 RepID=UPI0030781F9D
MTMSACPRLLRPAILVLALGLAGCASSTSGFVDEGQEDEAIDKNLIKGLMSSMGAIDPKERPIEYKPRAPLVVPPKRELPAPQDPNALTGNFPRNQEDVDLAMAKAAEKGQPDPGRAWTPDELARYRIEGAGRTRYDTDDRAAGRRLTPEEMRGQSVRNQEALALAKNPGPRRSLVEPPVEYRKPSPNAPLEPAEEKSSWKPSWWPL